METPYCDSCFMDEDCCICHIFFNKEGIVKTEKVCVKVKNLRLIGYTSLEDWINDSKNLYVGRRGRIWITENGEKRIFHYPQSKWHNPNSIKKVPNLEKNLLLYRQHLHDSGLVDQLEELRGLNLGCFCLSGKECHARVLVEMIEKK